ncbi:hypothetical protein DPMN_044644 [Dreissena polymorpha]|uniref:Uncharacterized protein n=1 Tax=Dreissena polymorpha TaxID=45954 RepID=A0A9D4HYX6_DREPO|nr:hypothetical protein DPMN_044644 [Dreissena polymorpha]
MSQHQPCPEHKRSSSCSSSSAVIYPQRSPCSIFDSPDFNETDIIPPNQQIIVPEMPLSQQFGHRYQYGQDCQAQSAEEVHGNEEHERRNYSHRNTPHLVRNSHPKDDHRTKVFTEKTISGSVVRVT